MLKRRGQEVIEYSLENLVQGQTELNGADFQRDPSQIAVTEMITLRTGFATLTFLGASQLLQVG